MVHRIHTDLHKVHRINRQIYARSNLFCPESTAFTMWVCQPFVLNLGLLQHYLVNLLSWIQGFNKVGLSTLATSWGFVVDMTPPVPGNVFDGPRQKDGRPQDIDAQTYSCHMDAHWDGFYEPHSVIKEYFISIGTCPNCQNVVSRQAVGLVQGRLQTHW